MTAAVSVKGQRAREAILSVATTAFAERGYGEVTLEDLAAGLGMTRSAVLYHFGSKEEILSEIVATFFARLDLLLDGARTGAPLSAARRRQFLTAFVDLLCNERAVSTLLARDITAPTHLGAGHQLRDRVETFCRILAGPDSSEEQRLRVMIALGGIVRPVSTSPEVVSLSTAAERSILVDCACASLRTTRARR